MTTLFVIDNDHADIAALRTRLPRSIDVIASDQSRAVFIQPQIGYSLIVLDNDANEGQSAIGPATLAKLRARDSETPILYTTWEPRNICENVISTPGVSIVHKQDLVERLNNMGIPVLHNLEDKSPPAQTDVIVTYNTVEGYPADMYGNGRLLIVSFDKAARSDAPRIVEQNMRRVFAAFERRRDQDKVRNLFVYDGQSADQYAGSMACSFAHDFRMEVHMLACHCDWERKSRLRSHRDIKLWKVNCGGQIELGHIADTILGIEQPGIELPIPREIILAESQRYRI